ncbi:U32 family peptidase [uncultured Phascolarctobacterium sp.]|uniref:DUF3656 domain-containing U32 family peptidase n=1 Tax=Phascolarctobacterium sp. TaxID=2049039 RepID=UPI0025D77CDC|nr:U32 family peptidase [uncultured Phascolarctobacterium sp.]
MKKQTIELLAPAGSWEALEAAVNAGADAVYMGGKAFGARQYASNFDREEMQKAVYFAHMHRVRLYITVNTLVDDSELKELADYLLFLSNVGIDGIIVQDLGVIRLARQIVPDLPLHASTQMTVTNSAGVELAAQAGMERVVLARELSLDEINKICHGTDTEIEVFIHGALCVCYSGQCLMSSLIGGRSGNRGRCAQPCRLPYKLVNASGDDLLEGKDAGQYLLSPKDMNTLEILPQLIEAGVASYKIEGRMKRPEYVAVVVDAYRRAIDSYLAGDYTVPEQDLANIEQIFNRDFTTAYLLGRPGKEMMSDRRPNNRGVLVGRVVKLDKAKNKATIKLDKELHLDDGLEFWVSVGGRVGTTVTSLLQNGEEVITAAAGTQVTIDVPHGIKMNDRVFRTFDNQLMTYAAQFFGEKAKRRIPVSAMVTAKLGSPMTVLLTDDEGNTGYGETAFIVEAARKHALNEETVRKQIDRLGTTEYELADLVLECDENVMVPMSEINEARRLAAEALDAVRLEAFAPARPQRHKVPRELVPQEKISRSRHAMLTVHADTPAKAQVALGAGADYIIFGGDVFNSDQLTEKDYRAVAEVVRSYGKSWAVATPRIVKEGQLSYFAKLFSLWEALQPDAVYISNNGLWQLAKKRGCKVPLWADMSLNIYNDQNLEFWREQGAVGATLSAELTMAQVEHLAAVSPVSVECMVQGRIEMMVSEYCVGGSFLGDLHQGTCKFKCREQLFLSDRKDAQFPIVTDQNCRMHILNAHDLSMLTNVKHMEAIGVQRLRMDARNYSNEATAELVALYKQVLNGYKEVSENLPRTTRGHYFRGVL